MAGSPSSRRAKTYSPSSLRTRSLSPALTLSSSSLRAVKAYKAIKREDLGMKEMEFGSECSETESEPRYPSEQLSGTERGRSLFQKDVRKVKRFRTNCSIPGGCGGCGGLCHRAPRGRRKGQSRAHAAGRAAHAAVPRPSRASGRSPALPGELPISESETGWSGGTSLSAGGMSLQAGVPRSDPRAHLGDGHSWSQARCSRRRRTALPFFFLIIILKRALLLLTGAPVNTALCSSSSSCDKWLTPVNSLDLTCVGGYFLFFFHRKIIASTHA